LETSFGHFLADTHCYGPLLVKTSA